MASAKPHSVPGLR